MTNKLPNPHEALTSGPVMQIEQVDFSFGQTQVLKDISLALVPGRLTVILGPNAAGKSTLLRLMLGRLRPDSGKILLGGRSVSDWPSEQRARHLAYVAQRPDSGFSFSVEQIVAMGRHAVGPSARITQEALRQFEIDDLADRSFLELSVGQQQRVVFARAAAQLASGSGGVDGALGCLSPRESAVMLLDEPTSAMDLRHGHGVFRWLRSWTQAGGSGAIVVHDINLAAAYADDVWLLSCGQLDAAGAFDSVLDAPRLSRVYEIAVEQIQVQGQDRPVFVVRGD